jgi:pilus assembly protein CpaB
MEITQQSKAPPVKGIIMLIISLLVGAAGVYLSKKFIEEKISFYRSQMDIKEELVDIVVPKQNMVRGQVVSTQNLAVMPFPKKYLDTNVVYSSNYETSIGQRLNYDVEGGKPLLWAHLDGGMAPTFSGKIEDGLRALTVPVDEINSVSGFLQPNDNVDLFITYNEKDKGQVIYPFMQNLHILATGVKTTTDKTGRASQVHYNTITVQVTPEDAKKIVLAQVVGKITATLRHPEDGVPMSDQVMTVADLLNKPKPVKKSKAKVKTKVKNEIEFIIGGV